MKDPASAKGFQDLGKISQTAWLTSYCHHECCRDWNLERPVSSWLIEVAGPPPFARDLSYFTRHGISARAKWFDYRLDEALTEFRSRREIAEVWTLGAGFDSRWDRVFHAFGDTISHYREFDLPALLDAKNEILAASPWAGVWAGVELHAGDVLANSENGIPVTDAPVVVILEGLLDYFGEAQKRALFDALRKRAPRARILLDAQSAWLLRVNNRRATKSTGAQELTFTWAPPDPVDFYDRVAGFRVERHHALLPDLLQRRFPLLRAVLMPRALRRAYCLIDLRPREEP